MHSLLSSFAVCTPLVLLMTLASDFFPQSLPPCPLLHPMSLPYLLLSQDVCWYNPQEKKAFLVKRKVSVVSARL